MVGLGVVLEAQKGGVSRKTHLQVLNIGGLMISTTKPSISVHNPPSFSRNIFRCFQTPTFLDRCFLCKRELLPGNDIYMYKGDQGFCSVECRCRQIFMDEESMQKDYISLTDIKSSPLSSSSSSRFL